jgi:ubiquinone/menaquinone biosynthesis C-methylase UbiE
MRSVDAPDFDTKTFVAAGYDACGEAYSAARASAAVSWLALVTEHLADGAAVLDIGCGSGVPVARALAQRFAVTAIDISAGQIERARQNVPRATFIQGDIMSLAFTQASFDAVVILYTLFHLPRDEQPELLARIRRWLKPDGVLLATLARTSHHRYVEDDFFGTSMYWSHFAEADYDTILRRAGLAVIERRKIGHGYSVDAKPEVHPLVLCRQMPD